MAVVLNGTWSDGQSVLIQPESAFPLNAYWSDGQSVLVGKEESAPPSGTIGIWGKPITQGLIT